MLEQKIKIITALGNPTINEKLKKEEKYEIIGTDIQYQDGVLEILDSNEEINLLILNGILLGELSIQEFINNIKNRNKLLEIIIILDEEKEEIKNYLISKGIFNIYYNDEISFEELIKIINKKNSEIEINNEIKNLKEIILKNNINSKNKNKLKKIINLFNKKIIFKNKKNKNKIISIIGGQGVGKTTVISLLGLNIKNKKILIIDFNILNNNLNIIFGIKNNKNYSEKDINKLIIKTNKNTNLLFIDKKIFNNLFLEKNSIKNNLNKLSENYDLILIDLDEAEYTKEIMKNSDLNILLIEPNLLGINKSKGLLEKYIHKWNLEKNKIKIIINKFNFYSIDYLILKKIFFDFQILGKLNLNNKYYLFINKNTKEINKKIKKEYLRIIKNLESEGN